MDQKQRLAEKQIQAQIEGALEEKMLVDIENWSLPAE